MMVFCKWMPLYSALILLVFRIGNINAQSCGDNYTTNYGVFASPNYPNLYDPNSECTYRIMPSTIGQITLRFDTFELDRSDGDSISTTCDSNTGHEVRSYSWYEEMAPVWLSSCSIGRLDFFSDSLSNFSTKGFKVQYQVSTIGCGKTVFTSSSGNISSPNYPQNYNNNENCTYSIWASEASTFTLTFMAFDLESDCQNDWVQIRCDNSSYILPKYCGSALPKPAHISNCHEMLIWFHTDGSNVNSGFRLQYSFTHDGCGRIDYAGLSGIMTSPNFPKAHNGMSPDCTFYLYPISSVSLAFQAFDLEPFADRRYGDYIQMYCWTNTREFSGHFFGNTLPPLITYTQCKRIVINYYNNQVVSGPGFNLKYQVNPLVAHSAITSGPEDVTVNVGSRVQLDCTSDAADYYPSWTMSKDGTDANTTVIAFYCEVNFHLDYELQYSAVKGGPGVCSLVIISATLAEAGIYTCTDVGLASSSSVVTVIENERKDGIKAVNSV